jgi:hypothetical protein
MHNLQCDRGLENRADKLDLVRNRISDSTVETFAPSALSFKDRSFLCRLIVLVWTFGL